MDNNSLGVVIPTVIHARAFSLISMLSEGTIKPDITVLIDNTKDGVLFDYNWLYPVTIVRLEPIPGVNASWEIGASVCGNMDYISFLNDDILITPRFIERIRNVINIADNHGIHSMGAICPFAVTKPTYDGYKVIERNESELIKMKHPEGWAFTIRRDIIHDAMPFPQGMKHFAGDNWLWWVTYEGHKLLWYKDLNNMIYHSVGASMTQEARSRLKKDHAICSKALLKRFPERHAIGARRKRRQAYS